MAKTDRETDIEKFHKLCCERTLPSTLLTGEKKTGIKIKVKNTVKKFRRSAKTVSFV
jgi:hypothetical protein